MLCLNRCVKLASKSDRTKKTFSFFFADFSLVFNACDLFFLFIFYAQALQSMLLIAICYLKNMGHFVLKWEGFPFSCFKQTKKYGFVSTYGNSLKMLFT